LRRSQGAKNAKILGEWGRSVKSKKRRGYRKKAHPTPKTGDGVLLAWGVTLSLGVRGQVVSSEMET